MSDVGTFARAALVASIALAACGGKGEELFAPGPTRSPIGGAAGAHTGGKAGNASGGKGGADGGTSQGGWGNGGAAKGGAGGAGGSGWGGSGWGGSGQGGATAGSGGAGYGGSAGCYPDPVSPPSGGSCVTTGATGYACNPVTNSGCNASTGEACDYDFTNQQFACFPAPNDTPGCGTCDQQFGPFCVGGFTCTGGRGWCTRYCCSNSDCAAGVGCVFQSPTSLGVCGAQTTDVFAGFAGAP